MENVYGFTEMFWQLEKIKWFYMYSFKLKYIAIKNVQYIFVLLLECHT